VDGGNRGVGGGGAVGAGCLRPRQRSALLCNATFSDFKRGLVVNAEVIRLQRGLIAWHIGAGDDPADACERSARSYPMRAPLCVRAADRSSYQHALSACVVDRSSARDMSEHSCSAFPCRVPSGLSSRSSAKDVLAHFPAWLSSFTRGPVRRAAASTALMIGS